MSIKVQEHVLNLYGDLIRSEFPLETTFGISFLPDSEDYADTIEAIEGKVGVTLEDDSGLEPITIISHYDYNESLLDNTIFSEVNRCYLNGRKFLKIITPFFIGDSHDIILAPNSYLKDIIYDVKKKKDYRINTSIHAPLINLPQEELTRDVLDFLDNKEFTEFCKKYSIKQKRGIIFAGPPGNGKTLMLAWLKSQALQRGMEFIAYTSAKEFLNDSDSIGRNNGRVTKKIIVFEEFDTYLQERDQGSMGQNRISSNQVQGTLLQILDGIEDINSVVFIFTTNFPQSFDNAIMRPGRIDRVINFNPPTKDQQIAFMHAYLEDYILQHTLILTELSKQNAKISYSMLKSIVDNIRIREFWHKQHNPESTAQVSESEIKEAIASIVESSNKGRKMKVQEGIL